MLEAKALKEAGFSEDMIRPIRPPLNERTLEALRIWTQMGRDWNPERLPMIKNAFGIVCLDGLMDRLLIIYTVLQDIRQNSE